MLAQASLRILLLLCALLTASIATQAQVRYTFVSMTGSDANDCLFATTACRTVQRAHDAVSPRGTVVIRDSGAYGAVNITKSVTISARGVDANLTATGANAVAVNINTAGIVVRLRELTINGINTSGTSIGINYQNGNALHVENCAVSGFGSGLFMSTPGHLYVSDSDFRNNGNGIYINAGAGTGAGPFGNITIERTLLEQNTNNGLLAAGGKTTIRQSRMAGNDNDGLLANFSGVEVTVDDCNLSHNLQGVESIVGPIVRVANSTIANNQTGLAPSAGGQILSRNPTSNTVEGNATPGAFTGNYTAQ